MEQLKTYLKMLPWVLLLIVVLMTGVLSGSGNSYRVSLDFNYGELLKIFKTTTTELSED